MYTKNYREVPVEATEIEGLTQRWVINKESGAENFSMRFLELEPGASTPLHQHNSEHEIFVLVGLGTVEANGVVNPIREGSVIYIAPNEVHKFTNTGASILRFIDSVMLPARIKK